MSVTGPSSLLPAIVSFLFLFCGSLLHAGIDEDYFAALRLLHSGSPAEASKAFGRLLSDGGGNMSGKQVSAVRARLKICKAALATDAEAAASHIAKAAAICSAVGSTLAGSQAKDPETARKLRKALLHLELASAHSDSDPRYQYLVAFCLVYQGKARQAEPFVEAALEKFPRAAQSHDLAAACWRQLGLRKKEAKALSRSLMLKPGRREVYRRLALALLACGQEKAALDAARKAAGRSKEIARELAKAFPEGTCKDELESLATELAIQEARQASFGSTAPNIRNMSSGRSSGGYGSRRGSYGSRRAPGPPPPGVPFDSGGGPPFPMGMQPGFR